ncbi:hypothetical protein [Azohydromonas sediminis]|uniref:hypothetical protein n=1 Tax=Azohydromonas sediminis TaxID=2259674 RepID=UPI003AF3FED8
MRGNPHALACGSKEPPPQLTRSTDFGTSPAIWAYLKKHEIANFCAKDIGEVSDYARRRLKSMQRRPTLVRAYWKQAELAF